MLRTLVNQPMFAVLRFACIIAFSQVRATVRLRDKRCASGRAKVFDGCVV